MSEQDPRWRENQDVYQAANHSANNLVPALEKIVRTGHWREFIHPMRGMQKFDSLAEYCEQFLELKLDAVASMLDASNFPAAANEVRRELFKSIPPAAKVGRPSKESENKKDGNTIISKPSDNTASRVIARLKRDQPELAKQVEDGELSPHRAAIQAGIRKPMMQVRKDDPVKAVQALLRCYSKQELIDALGDL